MKRIFKILTIVALLFVAGYFLDKFIPEGPKNFIESIAELLTVFVSISIFAMTWYAYGRSKDNHTLFFGAAFLIIGVLDFFHTFSYPFMPDFITPNTTDKAASFWFMTRLVSAPLFLVSVFIYKDNFPRLITRAYLITLSILLIFFLSVLVLFFHEQLPVIYTPEDGISTSRMFALPITSFLILYGSYLYTKRIQKTGENYLICLIYGFIILVLVDIIYFTYEIPAHMIKVAGFYFIFLSLYKSSVDLPYEKLAIAEEKLRRAAEEKYKNLFDNANDAIIIEDLKDRVTSWNKGAENIFGFSAQDVIGKKLTELIVPPELLEERQQQASDALTGMGISGIETIRMRKDGTKIDVSLTISPLIDGDGKIVGLTDIIRDITDHKKAEELRIETERLIRTSQTKSEFLAIMSHELRTPLNAVLGFSELLKMKTAGELNEKQKTYVDHVVSSGWHLLNLIENILDITQMEAGKVKLNIEKISLSDAINDSFNLIKTDAEQRNVIFRKEIDPEIEFIDADRKKFEQILFNLLSNAVKFSKPERGEVTVRAKKVNAIVQISVSDKGIGIKEEDMGKLFRTFQQLDMSISRKYGGTGLGLAITKQFVELHGGRIWAQSKYGEGSTFTFTIPLKDKEKEEQ